MYVLTNQMEPLSSKYETVIWGMDLPVNDEEEVFEFYLSIGDFSNSL